MTEQAQPAAAPAAAPSPLQIAINVQYIKDFSFENPNAPQIFAPSQLPPALNLGVNVQTRKLADNTHEVLLMLKLEAKHEDKVAFISELAYGGVFTIPAVSDEQLRIILLVEAPRLLFPFARAVIGNAIRDAGFPQLFINPIDFGALYMAQAAQLAGPVAGTA